MTEPLTPIDLDLRAFGFMPLEVVRLRDSDLAALATGDEFRAAVLLWCAAWHQVPAASLPNDDRLLAKLAGFGRDLKGWNSVRVEALRGFIECTDGRLYHPVIADIAIESGSKKRVQQSKTSKATEARIRKANERREVDRNVKRDGDRDVDRDGPRNEVQGIGEEVNGGERITEQADKSADCEAPRELGFLPLGTEVAIRPPPVSKSPKVRVDIEGMFNAWYEIYPKKIDRKDALKSFTKVISGSEATFDELIAGAHRYAADMAGTEKRFIKAPAVWLNKGSWSNEPIGPPQPPSPSPQVQSTLEGMVGRFMERNYDDNSR